MTSNDRPGRASRIAARLGCATFALLVSVAACSTADTAVAGGTCADAAKNGAETDVDCGGGSCAKCAVDLACAANGDCASGSCSGGKCAAPTCADKLANGDEADVDCGGA